MEISGTGPCWASIAPIRDLALENRTARSFVEPTRLARTSRLPLQALNKIVAFEFSRNEYIPDKTHRTNIAD